jgi:hypothetical protein
MTNLIETATATAKKALGLLLDATSSYQPGVAHLTGGAGAACLRASTLDEDLDVLLHEIQRRRGRS